VKLEQEFEVAAPIDRVWEALIDVERVAPNLPGAAVTGRNDDGTYNGTFAVKIGPTSASYEGRLAMEQADEASHTAVMQANGTDKRGQGGAKATITSHLSEVDGHTRVEVSTDYHITGRLARFGRGGMIEDISEKLLKQFADGLQQSLAGEPAPAPGSAAPGDSAPPSDSTPADDSAPAEQSEPQLAAGAATPATSPFPPTQPAEPLRAGSLVASVLVDRAKANPVPIVVALLALFLLIRRSRK
jgi:carbon monoxide dehydrogenase subunit G